MQSGRQIFDADSEGSEAPQIHREFASFKLDEGLLPLFEDRQRHMMSMEKQRQEDDTKTVQLLITKRGQFFSWTLAIGALIGGIYLISIGQEGIGVALLFGDASFVAINTLRDHGKKDT